LLRALWQEDSLDYTGKFHRVDMASINPRPDQHIPIWFGGAAPAALKRCARLGDGWIPLMGANDAAKAAVALLKSERTAAGKSWDGFEILAQAQYAGGTPERWLSHSSKWQEIGATKIAVATHNAGDTDVDGHLKRIEEYFSVVRG
jgi:alkanesulfonate monooxygenase SsuD/methylene tetrahydromethanopterin reductase-like flavin-dependent oxidoreductase (luciferase family)